MNNRNIGSFFDSTLPKFVIGIPTLPDGAKEMILRGVTPAADFPSFQALIKEVVADIRVYEGSSLSM